MIPSNRPVDLRRHALSALAYFIVAALLGLTLRLMPLVHIPVSYKFLLHTHSHIALLGWLYLGSTAILYHLYLRNKGLGDRYRPLVLFTHLTLLGMLFTFPFMGYALFSIIFSTLFLFASYWFTGFFMRHADREASSSAAYKCFKWSLIFLVFSSLGPWALGGIMQTLGSQSPWYRFAIYFYLHFLYNGWGVLLLFGLVFHLLEQGGTEIGPERFRLFFRWMLAGVFLTFFISIIWMEPSFVFYCLAVAGVIAQWAAFSIFLKILSGGIHRLKEQLSSTAALMLLLTGLFYGGKLILQTLVAVPVLTDLTFSSNDLVIGFLHWVFLGVLTIGLFTFLHQYRLLHISKTALAIYLAGFLLTECLLFYRAAAIWQQGRIFDGFMTMLPVVSALLPLALLIVFCHTLFRRE